MRCRFFCDGSAGVKWFLAVADRAGCLSNEAELVLDDNQLVGLLLLLLVLSVVHRGRDEPHSGLVGAPQVATTCRRGRRAAHQLIGQYKLLFVSPSAKIVDEDRIVFHARIEPKLMSNFGDSVARFDYICFSVRNLLDSFQWNGHRGGHLLSSVWLCGILYNSLLMFNLLLLLIDTSCKLIYHRLARQHVAVVISLLQLRLCAAGRCVAALGLMRSFWGCFV